MEAKKFLFKSSNILSVAILLASLTNIGSAGAQDIKSKTLPTPIVKYQKENYFGLLQKADEVSKQKVVFQVRQESPPPVIPKPIDNKQDNKIVKKVVPVESPQRRINVIATAYISDCGGCSGITSTGINVRNTTTYEGYTIIATDTSIIPLHTKVKVSLEDGSSFMAISEDTGGAIHGNIIDVLVGSERTAINFGRKHATLTIIKEGA